MVANIDDQMVGHKEGWKTGSLYHAMPEAGVTKMVEKYGGVPILSFSSNQYSSGPGCSKLTTSLVNETLKFQMLISQICQYFLLKKCEKLLHCKNFSHFFNKKYQCIWLSSHKTLNELSS